MLCVAWYVFPFGMRGRNCALTERRGDLSGTDRDGSGREPSPASAKAASGPERGPAGGIPFKEDPSRSRPRRGAPAGGSAGESNDALPKENMRRAARPSLRESSEVTAIGPTFEKARPGSWADHGRRGYPAAKAGPIRPPLRRGFVAGSRPGGRMAGSGAGLVGEPAGLGAPGLRLARECAPGARAKPVGRRGRPQRRPASRNEKYPRPSGSC